MSKTKNYPKISIITPSYNQGDFIEQTIKSVLDQKYPNLEYIVMDGGSTDQTLKILRKYSKKIKWISKKDRGQTDAINKGIKMATGDILAYINSDDYLLPGALKKVTKFFQAHKEATWVSGNYIIVDEKGKQIQKFVVLYKSFFRIFSSFPLLAILNFIAQPSTFWQRQVIKKVGKFDDSLRYVMDYDFWLRVIKKYKLYKLSTPLSAFRIHSQSKGKLSYHRQFNEELRVLRRYTTSGILYTLHKIHNFFIIAAYRLIK